jgi:4'-phosphopantetheinyl transferase
MNPEYSIKEGEVHLWLAKCDGMDDQYFRTILDGCEKERSVRFHSDLDTKRYVIAHGILRSLLAKYLDVEPERIDYEYGPFGKPAIAGGSPLRFNMSHSNGMAMYAFSLQRDVGIDLEYMRDIPFMELSQSVLSTNEYRYMQSFLVEKRPGIFFTLWVRKEAYVKAIGEGAYAKWRELDVSIQNVAHRISDGGPAWSIIDIPAPRGYMSAVAVRGDIRGIKTFQMY